jgi:FkbM family methyltransferase
MSVYINKLITTAYDKYGMMQMSGEVERFAKFFRDLKCKNIMEIGTYAGGLFSIMCKLSDEDGVKISVDLPVYENQENTEYYKNFLRDHKKFSKNVHFIAADSHKQETLEQVKQLLNGEELDFLFIDGDHSYAGVKQDFEMYKELVKDGGYIGFHDINDTEWHRNLNCYVAHFWDEIKNRYESTEINTKSYAMGIGVVQVFKHKRKLDVSVWFESPDKIHITNNSHEELKVITSVLDKHSKVPIYFCDMHFGGPGQSWWIMPLQNYNWSTDEHIDTFLIEFYDVNKNFIDSKELKIKNTPRRGREAPETRIFSPFDCLWINYKQMFLEGIYDKLEMDNLGMVLDIGANVGMFSNYIAMRGAKYIHAIEPTQKAYEQLKKQLYYYNNVKCHKIGIDKENGQKTLFTNNENSTISSFLHKTSADINEELITMYTLASFYANNNIERIDLIKMDIEGMEYDIFDSTSDNDILRCEKYLVEYHLNSLQNNRAENLINRFKKLGYELEIHPDNVEDTQGFFFAQKKKNQKNVDPSAPNQLPKRAYVTLTNDYYLPITERLVKSLQKNSNYPIIVYSINCDVNFSSPNMFARRIDSDFNTTARFDALDKVISHRQGETVEVILPTDSMGIVNRNDLGTYIMLSRKPFALLDAINNGVEEAIFLDADGIAKENIDTGFDYLTQCETYPLVGKGLFEYMMLNGIGDPAVGPTLEQPLMDLLGVTHRTMYYVSTNFILFTSKMKPFIQEWATLADHPAILKNNLKYAPYHDETLMNVLLWKYNASKQLPRVHYNLTDFQSALEFYTTNKRDGYTSSDWHYIPADINDIKFFHGCKSPTEIDKTIEFIELRKNKSQFNYHYKKFKFGEGKIAIVTLFDDNYRDLADVALPDKVRYASKHGYDFIYFDEIIDSKRPPQWSKVKAVESILNDYEWVWWIDIDALIMNDSIKLENIIDNNYDVIFTNNKYSVISNGSSFYKNSDFTRKFLNECYTLQHDVLKNIDVSTFDHEQKPMRALYQSVPEYASHIKLIHERECNSYWYTENPSVLGSYPNWNNEDNIYQNGDFVVNFCGRDKNERVKIMKEFINK